MAQDRALAPAAPPPAAHLVHAIERDRVHPFVAIAVIVAILLAGVGAYAVLRPEHSNKTVATAEGSTTVGLNDDQVVEALTFGADDAPTGWSYAVLDHRDTTAGSNLPAPACSTPGTEQSVAAKSGGVKLTNGDYLALEAVDLQRTTENVVTDFNNISRGEVLDCIRGEVVTALGPLLCSCTGIHAVVVPMVAPPLAPDSTYAFRFTIDVDGKVVVQADAYFIGEGRAEISLLFASKGGNFPSDAEANLTRTAIERLRDTPTSNKTA